MTAAGTMCVNEIPPEPHPTMGAALVKSMDVVYDVVV
jgi:hypothetical protein